MLVLRARLNAQIVCAHMFDTYTEFVSPSCVGLDHLLALGCLCGSPFARPAGDLELRTLWR